MPVAPEVTVAFSVTGVPSYCGLAGDAANDVVVGIAVIVNGAVPVEPLYPLVVGVKTALRVSSPTGSAVVDVEAIPPLTVTGVPISVGVLDPVVVYWNCTLPATPVVTVAFNVTDVPTAWGLDGVVASDVVVGSSEVTVKGAVPVEPLYPLVVGVKTALSVSSPTGSAVVDVEAIPPLTVTGVPISVGVLDPVVVYSNCTLPATPVFTVAFNVTDVPTDWGLDGDTVSVVVVGSGTVGVG